MELPITMLKGMNQSELLTLFRLIKDYPTSEEVLKDTNSNTLKGKQYLEQSVFISKLNYKVKNQIKNNVLNKAISTIKEHIVSGDLNAKVDFSMLFNKNSNFTEDEIIVLDNSTHSARTFTRLIECKKAVYTESDYKRMIKELKDEKRGKRIFKKEKELVEHI